MFTITYLNASRKLYTISTPNKETALRTFAILRRHYAARLWHSTQQEQSLVF